MRKLMWFTIGFSGACALGAYALFGDPLIVIALAILTLCGVVWLLCRHFGWKPVPVLAMLGFALGLLWYWVYDGGYLKPAAELDGITTKAAIEVLD